MLDIPAIKFFKVSIFSSSFSSELLSYIAALPFHAPPPLYASVFGSYEERGLSLGKSQAPGESPRHSPMRKTGYFRPEEEKLFFYGIVLCKVDLLVVSLLILFSRFFVLVGIIIDS